MVKKIKNYNCAKGWAIVYQVSEKEQIYKKRCKTRRKCVMKDSSCKTGFSCYSTLMRDMMERASSGIFMSSLNRRNLFCCGRTAATKNSKKPEKKVLGNVISTMIPAHVLRVQSAKFHDVDRRLPRIRLHHKLPHVDPLQVRVGRVRLLRETERASIRSVHQLENRMVGTK